MNSAKIGRERGSLDLTLWHGSDGEATGRHPHPLANSRGFLGFRAKGVSKEASLTQG